MSGLPCRRRMIGVRRLIEMRNDPTIQYQPTPEEQARIDEFLARERGRVQAYRRAQMHETKRQREEDQANQSVAERASIGAHSVRSNQQQQQQYEQPELEQQGSLSLQDKALSQAQQFEHSEFDSRLAPVSLSLTEDPNHSVLLDESFNDAFPLSFDASDFDFDWAEPDNQFLEYESEENTNQSIAWKEARNDSAHHTESG
ncbi:hypothetical protein V1512DRAFT_256173 [Lipomyces arxii]|uniref:uncharacterized protein n=1 Tax=Lipomyces arxii TaxID=56418 RepID=UPI0034CE6F69